MQNKAIDGTKGESTATRGGLKSLQLGGFSNEGEVSRTKMEFQRGDMPYFQRKSNKFKRGKEGDAWQKMYS